MVSRGEQRRTLSVHSSIATSAIVREIDLHPTSPKKHIACVAATSRQEPCQRNDREARNLFAVLSAGMDTDCASCRRCEACAAAR